jgi:hypothetical protein
MNVLMISLGDDMLRNPLGDVVERHLDYARCAGGTIHMVTYESSVFSFGCL